MTQPIRFNWFRALEGLLLLSLTYLPGVWPWGAFPEPFRVPIAFFAGMGFWMEVADYREKLRSTLRR